MRDIESERREIEAVIAGRTTCDLLQRNAGEFGGMPALSWRRGDEWTTLTWSGYRREVAAATLGLIDLGVERGDVVALMATTRHEHVLADQGVVHAGATPMTIYQTLAPEQISYIVRDSGATVAILEDRELLETWTGLREELEELRTIVVMEDGGDLDQRDDLVTWTQLLERGRTLASSDPDRIDELAAAVEPDDLCCLIYTSGTTGPPKGVEITQTNVMAEIEADDRIVGLPQHATNVCYLPLAHIVERVISIYLPQQIAGHTYFCPDVSEIRDYLLRARPELFFGVPRVWEKFRNAVLGQIQAEESEAKRRLAERAIEVGTGIVRLRQSGQRPSLVLRAEHKALDALVAAKIRKGVGLDRCQVAASGAAPLPVDVAEFFAALGLPVLEMYGLTETTAAATINPPGGLRIGTVGQPIPGTEVRIADDGEVLIRGPVTTRGYLGLPEQTGELLDDDGWLHTGDIGELDEDGYLSIRDRKKELIITAGGKNVSPATVEAHLKEHPLVGQALAYGDGRPYLVALLVLDGDMAPQWAEQHGVEGDDLATLAEDPQVRSELDAAVEAANARLARPEQIKRWAVVPTEWTAESEELTPTLKLKRRVIHEKYAEEIEALYE